MSDFRVPLCTFQFVVTMPLSSYQSKQNPPACTFINIFRQIMDKFCQITKWSIFTILKAQIHWSDTHNSYYLSAIYNFSSPTMKKKTAKTAKKLALYMQYKLSSILYKISGTFTMVKFSVLRVQRLRKKTLKRLKN